MADKRVADKLFKLKRSREGYLLNARNKIVEANTLLESDVDVALTDLQTVSDRLSYHSTKVSEINDQIVDLLAADEDFGAEFDQGLGLLEEIDSVATRVRVKIQELLSAKTVGSPAPSEHSVGSAFRDVSAKLPKLTIEKFGGDPLKWQTFWDSFDSAIHSKDSLSSIDKFNYLKCFLVGEAARSIAGISVTNANYQTAIDRIQRRFGRRQLVIFAHVAEFVNLGNVPDDTVELRNIFDEFERHLAGLESLNLDMDKAGFILIPIMFMKLPETVHLELEKQHGNDDWDLVTFRKLLENYLVCRELAEKEKPQTSVKVQVRKQMPTMGTMLNSGSENIHCIFCEGNHWSDQCDKLQDVDSRKAKIRGRCFLCLSKDHQNWNCQSFKNCFYCKGRHHRALCHKKFGNPDRVVGSKVNQSQRKPEGGTKSQMNAGADEFYPATTMLVSSSPRSLVQTAVAETQNLNGTCSQMANIYLDPGSHMSFITTDLMKKLKLVPKYYRSISVAAFQCSQSKTQKVAVVDVGVICADGSSITIAVHVVPRISAPIYRKGFDSRKFLIMKEVRMADPKFDQSGHIIIDLLIGNDYYPRFAGTERIGLTDEFFLLRTRFGWVPTGQFVDDNTDSESLNLLVLPASEQTFDCQLENFWNLDSIGIRDSGQVLDDDLALKKFNDTVLFENGRYYVTWPWKDEEFFLPENFQLAVGRLKSLISRISSDFSLVKKYDNVIQEQLKLGIIEKVSDGVVEGTQKHYIPHHCVLTPGKATTKVRIVYDASAKAKKNFRSLNECLYRGPVMLNDLCGLLMRFRLNSIVMLSDIEKAFLQVGLQPVERYVTRFVWLKNIKDCQVTKENLEMYRFCRVPFGVISSPFLLSATVAHHLKQSGSLISEQILRNIYVDNVICGASSVQEAENFYTESKMLFKNASMNLREWVSNSPELMKKIPEPDHGDSEKVKVLGICWDVKNDTINIPGPKTDFVPQTKRDILKSLSEIFDPLGYFSPVTVRAKIFLQDLWKEKKEWDENLTDDLLKLFELISRDFKHISEISVPRFIGLNFGGPLIFELHCFSDASKAAYACTVYLRIFSENGCQSNLIFAKTRLAPVKEISLPRLELLGVVIGTRALNFVEKQLNLVIEKKFLWTDSKCVLYWVQNKKLKSVFVENRLRELRAAANVEFRYVPTENNPADLPTRGKNTNEIQNLSFWWHGPDWLFLDETKWPKKCPENKTDGDLLPLIESEEKVLVLSVGAGPHSSSENFQISQTPFNIDISRFSNLKKLLRVTAYASRFIEKLRQRHTFSGSLKAEEIIKSRNLWEKYAQQRHFSDVLSLLSAGKKNCLIAELGLYLDDKFFIRCCGRLKFSRLPENAKNPKLLPKNDSFTNLVISDCHSRLYHSGVRQTLAQLRQEYWLPSGRSQVQKVLKTCLICRKWEGGHFQSPVCPPLPEARVSEMPAFVHTGVDYFGPMYIHKNCFQNSNSETTYLKVWVCLFTCAVTRAIHLELVTDMTAEQFLLCFRRFISRRGRPRILISDNAKQFKVVNTFFDRIWREVIACNDVQNYVANEGIKWIFIVELAPWMGGFYERLVGSVKRALRKSVGKNSLNFIQLQTIITEIEAILNSRPITYVTSDVSDNFALTPAHFLLKNTNAGLPNLLCDTDPDFKPKLSSADFLIEKWRKGQSVLNDFWNSWRNDYLLNLRERNDIKKENNTVRDQPSNGDVVLLKDSLPRSQWRVAKVENIRISQDGACRSAVVKLPNGKLLNRPVKLLFPIEYSAGQENEVQKLRTPQLKNRRKAAINAQEKIKNLASAGMS